MGGFLITLPLLPFLLLCLGIAFFWLLAFSPVVLPFAFYLFWPLSTIATPKKLHAPSACAAFDQDEQILQSAKECTIRDCTTNASVVGVTDDLMPCLGEAVTSPGGDTTSPTPSEAPEREETSDVKLCDSRGAQIINRC